jgi:hypothetical protein
MLPGGKWCQWTGLAPYVAGGSGRWGMGKGREETYRTVRACSSKGAPETTEAGRMSSSLPF